jgi:hypothetical protein
VGDGSSRLVSGEVAASAQAGQLAPDDFDVLSSDSETLYAPDDYPGLEPQPPVVEEGTGWGGDQSDMWSGDTVIHRPPEMMTRGRARVRLRDLGFPIAPNGVLRRLWIRTADSGLGHF